MKSFNDAEGAQDFLDDKMRHHLTIAYINGFRTGAIVGAVLSVIGMFMLIILSVDLM